MVERPVEELAGALGFALGREEERRRFEINPKVRTAASF
jgi:hypothetical protein